MMFVFAATLLLAACGKDTDREPSTENPVAEPEPHTEYLICDGKSYDFVKETGVGIDGYYQVVITPADTSGDYRIELKVEDDYIGERFNLVTSTDGIYSIDVIWGAETTFSCELFDGQVYSVLSGTIYEDASAISEGSFYTQLTDVDYSTELDVLLANGHRIRIGTVTPVADIVDLPACNAE